jgi:hypothetical protein
MARGKRSWGSIRKLPSGRYQVRYLGPDREYRPAPVTFTTKTDASARPLRSTPSSSGCPIFSRPALPSWDSLPSPGSRFSQALAARFA